MRQPFHNPYVQQAIIFVLAIFLLWWELGTHDVQEWDEARNGVNAWYMYYNHDYVNYYYGNELDTWNAKPPLMIWLITLSYHIFGFNEFALRFPSALSALIFFVVLYRLVRRYSNASAAFLTILILFGCRAIISFHVGRTGDFDSLLLLFLTCSVFYFCRHVFDGHKYAIYLLALFTGLAFYTKGTAGLLYIPGMFLFLLINRQLLSTLRQGRTYIGISIFVVIVSSWIGLVYSFGKSSEHSVYGTKNSIETMFIHDTYKRLASDEFSSNAPRDNFFFSTVWK